MSDVAHQLDHTLSDSQADERVLEIRRLGLVLLCVLVGLVAGYVGGGVERDMTWVALAGYLGTSFVAFLVAAALLRLVDASALRGRVFARAKRSVVLSQDIRRRLEERDPEVAHKAREIDAAYLVDQALGHDSNAAPPRGKGSRAAF
jgi:hypothetical protein